MTVHEHAEIAATDDPVIDPFGVRHDLEIVGAVVARRLRPGVAESNRVACVRQLLDASAELDYAVSAYTHRVLMHAGRRPVDGDVREETDALHDALITFVRQVRQIADTCRSLVETRFECSPEARAP